MKINTMARNGSYNNRLPLELLGLPSDNTGFGITGNDIVNMFGTCCDLAASSLVINIFDTAFFHFAKKVTFIW